MGGGDPIRERGDRSRYYGKAGEVKVTYNKNLDDRFETIMGDDGRVVKEIHYTTHYKDKAHTNPHTHNITWDEKGNPHYNKED